MPLLSHLAPNSCRHPFLAGVYPLVTSKFKSPIYLKGHLCLLRRGWPLPAEAVGELGGEGERN